MMSNVPKLRFKEFSGNFEYDILDELFKISSKKFDPSKQTKVKKCVELEHLAQETGNLLGYTHSNQQASIKNSFEKGQVLFGKLRPYLKKFWQASFDGVCSSEIWVLDGQKLNNSYLYHFVQTNKFNQIANVSSGSKMPRSDWQYMSQVPFSYPQKSEQEKIASFLTSVDTKIELLTKKEDLLQQYKKGVMQKIFSQEIRFQADDGSEYPAWNEKKLKDLTNKKSSNISANTLEKNTGVYKIYGATGYLKNVDFFIEEEPYISIVKDGAGVGRVLLCDAQSSVLGTLDMIKNNSDMDLYFIYSMLTRIHFEKYVVGSTIPHIYYKDYSNEKIQVPYLEEQTKIANFLSSIDTKIEHIQKQLDSTKAFKKALLQQMFV